MSELTDDEKDRRVQLEYSRIMFETVRNQRDEAMAEVEKLREKLAWEQESHKRTARMLRAKVQPEITLEMLSRL